MEFANLLEIHLGHVAMVMTYRLVLNHADIYIVYQLDRLVTWIGRCSFYNLVLLVTQLKTESSPLPIYCRR